MHYFTLGSSYILSNILNIWLHLTDSPVCKSGQETSFSAVLNKPIHIRCEVEADPDDVTFRWEFNGTGPGGDQQVLSSKISEPRSILSYTPRTELDFGVFFCWARNSIGFQKEPCIFVINPTGSKSFKVLFINIYVTIIHHVKLFPCVLNILVSAIILLIKN